MSKLSAPVLGNILGFEFGLGPFKETTYPPYNIVQVGDDRIIELAVAGFDENSLEVIFQQNVLTVRSLPSTPETNTDEAYAATGQHGPLYIYKGISSKAFSVSWKISPEFNVGHADFYNGILKIKLEYNPPEALKPRVIDIVRSDRILLNEDTSNKKTKAKV